MWSFHVNFNVGMNIKWKIMSYCFEHGRNSSYARPTFEGDENSDGNYDVDSNDTEWKMFIILTWYGHCWVIRIRAIFFIGKIFNCRAMIVFSYWIEQHYHGIEKQKKNFIRICVMVIFSNRNEQFYNERMVESNQIDASRMSNVMSCDTS